MDILTNVEIVNGQIHFTLPVEALTRLLEPIEKTKDNSLTVTLAALNKILEPVGKIKEYSLTAPLETLVKNNKHLTVKHRSRYTGIWDAHRCLIYFWTIRDTKIQLAVHNSIIDPILPLDRDITEDTRFYGTKTVTFTEVEDLEDFLNLLNLPQ